jgi:hypothetical protein
MAHIRFLSQPELYAAADGSFQVSADCSIYLDDGRELPGFHRTILVTPAGLDALEKIAASEGPEAAFAYIVARIGEANEGYSLERIFEAIRAMYLKDAIISVATLNKLSFPLDVPLAMPVAAQQLEQRMVTAQG